MQTEFVNRKWHICLWCRRRHSKGEKKKSGREWKKKTQNHSAYRLSLSPFFFSFLFSTSHNQADWV